MVQKEENGYSINGMHIDYQTALELYTLFDHEYNKEDIVSMINDKYGKGIGENLPEELISKVAHVYKHSFENSEDWTYHAEYAIQENKDEIESAIAAAEVSQNKSDKNNKTYEEHDM